MSRDDQIRWDKQHSEAPGSDRPSSFLAEILDSSGWHLTPGKALDIACGKGRNALYLACRGFAVTALDISPVALEEGRRRAQEKSLQINWRQADLEDLALDQAAYDLVVNLNYLQRSLIEPIKRAMKIGGHVIFETYSIDQAELGHPKNPDYLLRHNELLECFSDLRILFYRAGRFTDCGAESFRAGILAQKVS